jgi:nitrogen fixation protein NifB
MEGVTMTTFQENHVQYVAAASSDGAKINLHLGEADHLLIYDTSQPKPKLVALRRIHPASTEESRWDALAEQLQDCSLLLVGGIGPFPRSVLDHNGIRVRTVQGRIDDLLGKLDEIVAASDDSVPFVCGSSCRGNQMGCGGGPHIEGNAHGASGCGCW